MLTGLYRWLCVVLLSCAGGCASDSAVPHVRRPERFGRLTVGAEVVDDAYVGNGVQWDPYEAHVLDGRLSVADREKLCRRLDFMRPHLVRVMDSTRAHLTAAGELDPGRGTADLEMILDYCRRHDIAVIYGDWGGGMADAAAGRIDTMLIDRAAQWVAHLVDDRGYDCIRYYNMVNEPNGFWSPTDGDYGLWRAAAGELAAALDRHGVGGRVALVGPDAAVWTPAETGWVERCAADLGDRVGLYDIHTYPSKSEVNSGEYGEMIAAYRRAAPAGAKMVMGELGFKYIDPRDSLYEAENRRRIAAAPHASAEDSQMLVYDTMYGTDMADAIIQTAAAGYSGCVVWMLDDAMHFKEPGKLKIWGFWNILGEERYGAGEERIRPWYYAVSLLCRYLPPGCRILRTTVEGAEGVRAVAACSGDGCTLAAVNTHPTQAVELAVEGALPDLEGASVYLYGADLRLEGERLLPVRSGVKFPFGGDGRLVLDPETLVVVTTMDC